MKRVRLGAISLALLVLVVAGTGAAWWFNRRVPDTTSSTPPPAGAVSVVDGVTVVQLAAAVQRRSGLVAAPVAAAEVASESTVYGVVVDLQPLVDWHARFVTATAQAQAARSQQAAAEAELERTRALYDDARNASRKALDAAQASAQRERAAAQAAAAMLDALREQAAQQFGPVLAGWAVADGADLRRLLGRRDSIVAIAPGAQVQAPPRALSVAMGGGARLPATWLSAAPQADARLGAGLQWYRVAAPLPANANVQAFLPATVGRQGVFVPSQAVIWYADQPWTYVRRDASHFARVPLLGATETDGGFVAPAGIAPGQQVVTQGAGLLLSQEQLPPPGAPACKDPECDD